MADAWPTRSARSPTRTPSAYETPSNEVRRKCSRWDSWHSVQRANAGLIRALGPTTLEVGEKARPCILARAEEDRIGVPHRLCGQRRHVQPAERDVSPTLPVVVRDPVCTLRRRDIDLNHDQIRCVREIEGFDMLVLDFNFRVIAEVPGERRQAQASTGEKPPPAHRVRPRHRRPRLPAAGPPDERDRGLGG